MQVRRFRLVGLVVVVLIAAMAFSIARTSLPEPPLVQFHRQQQRGNERLVRMWQGYIRLARLGVTQFQPGLPGNNPPGETLIFNHFVPRDRPTDPIPALAFDREKLAVERKSQAMRDHYQRLADKWADAARRRLATVPPDPPPPYNIELGNMDSAL